MIQSGQALSTAGYRVQPLVVPQVSCRRAALNTKRAISFVSPVHGEEHVGGRLARWSARSAVGVRGFRSQLFQHIACIVVRILRLRTMCCAPVHGTVLFARWGE